MDACTQMELWGEGELILARFDDTMDRTRRGGLKIWSLTLRDWLADVTARRKDAYEQLMLLEAEVEAGDKAAALERIAKVKGMIVAVCLGLVVWGMVASADPVMRPVSRPVVARTARREEAA